MSKKIAGTSVVVLVPSPTSYEVTVEGGAIVCVKRQRLESMYIYLRERVNSGKM
jgi:hypothetical protein